MTRARTSRISGTVGGRRASALIAACFVLGATQAAGAPGTSASPSPAGAIAGRVVVPPGPHPALSLFVENVETDVVVVVPLEASQETYSAVVEPGTYRVYAWLPDFSLLGAHTACDGQPGCADHTLLSIPVGDGQTVADADVTDWFVPDSPLIVLRGRLIDGTGAGPIDDGALALWEHHIVAVGPAAGFTIPHHALHYSLPGTTILPGFINAHVHNVYVARNLRLWAQAGVTTVRDLGARVETPWDMLRTYFEDDPQLARILAAGPLVTCPDGYPIVPNGFTSLTIDSEQEARDAINELIDRGADVIKIVIESGVAAVLSVELATVVVDTAHARGIPVTVHINWEVDLESALDAGVDDVAHIAFDHAPDDVIQRMVDADVGWVPTLHAVGGYGPEIYDNLARFVAAGGRVALGNDAGFLAGLVIGMPMPEIEDMQHAGMSPMEIIVAATSDAAIVCRRQDLLGALEPGKIADVLVVEGDPLSDLHVLEEVRMVIHNGEIIRHEPPAPRRGRGRAGPG